MEINKYYLTNPSLYYIYQLGFHYSSYNEGYVLTFPITRYKGRPTLFCKLVYNIVDNILIFVIIRPNNELNSTYYNQTYGNAKDYIKKINSIVGKKIKSMGFKKKKKQVNNKQKEKKE